MKGKKVIAVGLIVGALGAGFVGCTAKASSVANTAEREAKSAIQLVSSVETLKQSDFKMPSIIGGEFFENPKTAYTRTSLKNGVKFGEQNYKYNENYNEPVNVYRTNAYKSKFYNRESLKQNRTQLDGHIDKLNDLYLVAADIQAANMQIDTLKSEIKTEANALAKNARSLKKSKDANPTGNTTEFSDYSAALKGSINQLKRNKGAISKEVKRLPKDTNTYVGNDALTNRYKLILNKMEERINALEAIKVNLSQMNEFINPVQKATPTTRPERVRRERKIREIQPQVPTTQPDTIVMPETSPQTIDQPQIEQPQFVQEPVVQQPIRQPFISQPKTFPESSTQPKPQVEPQTRSYNPVSPQTAPQPRRYTHSTTPQTTSQPQTYTEPTSPTTPQTAPQPRTYTNPTSPQAQPSQRNAEGASERIARMREIQAQRQREQTNHTPRSQSYETRRAMRPTGPNSPHTRNVQ